MLEQILCAIAILGVLFALIMVYDTHRFVVRHYKIQSDKLCRPCRLVVLADLHNKQFGVHNEKLLQAIAEAEPDGILIAGDMLTAVPGRQFDTAVELLAKLAEKYPVYYGPGNHEHRMKLYPDVYGDMAQRYEAALREKGLQIMCNTHITLPKQNIIVYGAEIKEECYRHFRMYPLEEDYMASILGIPDKEQFIILLAHNPDYFTRYAEWGADLVLSGHVHGGLMKLPFLGGVISPALKLFPKYDGGLFQKEGSTMILSRGLGTHTLPIRILNPGELIVVQLQPKKQDFS